MILAKFLLVTQTLGLAGVGSSIPVEAVVKNFNSKRVNLVSGKTKLNVPRILLEKSGYKKVVSGKKVTIYLTEEEIKAFQVK